MSGAADGLRAVWDHLETLGDAAFSGAAPVTPKALSPVDPVARVIGENGDLAVFCLVDTGTA
ncbi:MAG: hypothetical protein AAF565_18955, partial [Pseudomonadota bacterium]